VFYGAAQVSKDIDFVVYASEDNFERLLRALDEVKAARIAVPRFDPIVLARGHAVHFRCQAAGVEGLRVDLMTRLRDVGDFDVLWDRRTTFGDEVGNEFHLLSVPDLVSAKKTQRARDWPVIELLVTIHHRENAASPRPDWIEFWLLEARTPELIIALCDDFPAHAAVLHERRPLLKIAPTRDLDALRTALDAEVRAEQTKDRTYWEPLRKELEQFRLAERNARSDSTPS
jgi:hypothetical protein